VRAVAKYVPEANREGITITEEGLAGATDAKGEPIRRFMYNPGTRTLIADNGESHASLAEKYAPGQDYDSFVKMGVEEPSSWNPTWKVRVWADRHQARDEDDAWKKSMRAVDVMKECGFPDGTSVQVLSYQGGRSRTVATFELGEKALRWPIPLDGSVSLKAHRGRWRTLKTGQVVAITGTPRAPKGGVAVWGPGKERDERRRGGIYDVVSETDEEGAKVLLTQGIEPSFKARIPGASGYAPGKGLEREGLYVSDAEASSKGSFGKVRLYMSVGKEHLGAPQEMRQLGRVDLDDVVGTENGAVTKGRLPRDVFKAVEVSRGGGKWERMTPSEYLKSVGVDAARVPQLPSVPEYGKWVRRNAERFHLRSDQVEDVIHDYNRGTLEEKVSMAREMGGEGSKAKSSSGRWVTIRGRRVFVRKGGARPGGASVVKSPSKEQVANWREQIEGWDGPRRGVAGDALYSIESDEHQALIVESGGELKAIAAFQEPYFVEGGIMGQRKIGHSVTVPYLATKERGYGLRLMQELAQRAAEDGGLRFNATDKSRGFYEAIGMGEYAQGGNLFNLTFEQARQWLETSGQKAKGSKPKRKVPEWLAESMEPGDGVFIVKRDEGVKARGRGGSFGRWRTLKTGRRVFVSGGLPGGNKAPSLFVNRGGQPPPAGTHIYVAYGQDEEIDPERFDRFLHDFEEMPDWATRDIKAIELHTEEGRKFTAGGEEFVTGASYNNASAKIRVFNANSTMQMDRENSLLYHEVGHNLEHRWRDIGNEEISTAHREHPDWFRDDGDVHRQHRAAYKKTYPIGSTYDRFTRAWLFDKEDGITPYSKAWAKEGNFGETFAEMAKIYFRDGWSAVTKAGIASGAGNLAQAFNDAMTAFSKGQDKKDLDEKARGRGGSYGRWRTLKTGRRVFVTGGTPEGGLSIRTGPGVMDRTLFDTFGDVEPERVDKFIHDFEELPSWATKDIISIEMYEQPGARFTAGGEDFQTGMDYTQIRVFQANEELSARFTNEGLYHEVGHNLDKRWKDAALAEQGASFREHRDWYSKKGMVFDEAHRSEFNKAYPLAASRRQFLQAWSKGEDGISPYSSAWAKEDRNGETIAEFARYYFGGYSRGGPKVSRRNVGVIGDEKGAPNLARAFADAMEALAKG
jgi:hypothetical protein